MHKNQLFLDFHLYSLGRWSQVTWIIT